VKIAKILLPWQQGLAREKFIGTITLAIAENPMFGANSAALAFTQAELRQILCEKSPIFVTMATIVGPGKI